MKLVWCCGAVVLVTAGAECDSSSSNSSSIWSPEALQNFSLPQIFCAIFLLVVIIIVFYFMREVWCSALSPQKKREALVEFGWSVCYIRVTYTRKRIPTP